jgi:hypothetical protein
MSVEAVEGFRLMVIEAPLGAGSPASLVIGTAARTTVFGEAGR